MNLFFPPTHCYNYCLSTTEYKFGSKHGKHDSANLSCIDMELQGSIRLIGQVLRQRTGLVAKLSRPKFYCQDTERKPSKLFE